MERCGDKVYPICDFCIYYKDNSIIHNEKDFSGNGICEIYKKEVSSCYWCKKYTCFKNEDKKEN